MLVRAPENWGCEFLPTGRKTRREASDPRSRPEHLVPMVLCGEVTFEDGMPYTYGVSHVVAAGIGIEATTDPRRIGSTGSN